MTIKEMRKEIKEECCNSKDSNCCINNCPLKYKKHCWALATDEEVKENYELMFGKEETEMKNEFDFNELKAGYAIKLPSGSFCVGMQTDENVITFFERFKNGELSAVCTKEDIINNKCENEIKISFYPIEVYGYSENYKLFNPNTRPLLWKKEEDMNTKEYNIGKLSIVPNYDKYKTDKEEEGLYNGFICISVGKDEYGNDSISIHKSELDDVINALTEIKDFIKED